MLFHPSATWTFFSYRVYLLYYISPPPFFVPAPISIPLSVLSQLLLTLLSQQWSRPVPSGAQPLPPDRGDPPSGVGQGGDLTDRAKPVWSVMIPGHSILLAAKDSFPVVKADIAGLGRCDLGQMLRAVV